MEDMQAQLGALLSNPQMMQKIMELAQNFQSAPPPPEPPPKQEADPPFAMPDMNTLRKLSGIVPSGGIDKNQQSLLRALDPYLSRQRINRLERAMRAAKMAGMATSLLGKTGR